MSQFEDEIILPLKRHLTGEADLEPFQAWDIEKSIRRCDSEYHAILFDGLETASLILTDQHLPPDFEDYASKHGIEIRYTAE